MLPTSGNVSAADWNAEFDAIASSLNAANKVRRDSPTNMPCVMFSKSVSNNQCPSSVLNNATPSKYTSLFFTAPSNIILCQLGLSMSGLALNTGTIELRPFITANASTYASELAGDLLEKDGSGMYPSLSITTSTANPDYKVTRPYDATKQWPRTMLLAGRRYELRLSLGLSSTQPWVTYFASFMAQPSR